MPRVPTIEKFRDSVLCVLGCLVVQRQSYASIAEEGCANSARRPEGGTRARVANLGWASPSVRPGLNIRQGQWLRDDLDAAILPNDLRRVRDVAEDL
jgi:hypothetical protein